jgi:hypothetical protein
MTHSIDAKVLSGLSERLNDHPLYATVRTLDDLRLFMAHHVYSVWDFMSLLKYLQFRIAPASVPWTPSGSPSVRFFINQIVLGEESDEGLPDAAGNPTYASHFELYCDAMREVGADPAGAIRFSETAAAQGVAAALTTGVAPAAAQAFIESTFAFIATGKPHVVAAAFAFGREHIIPAMFPRAAGENEHHRQEAPTLPLLPERHIHLDGFSRTAVAEDGQRLIGGDAVKARGGGSCRRAAVEARLKFWDGVQRSLRRLLPEITLGGERAFCRPCIAKRLRYGEYTSGHPRGGEQRPARRMTCLPQRRSRGFSSNITSSATRCTIRTRRRRGKAPWRPTSNPTAWPRR